MQNNSEFNQKNVPFASRHEVILCATLGCAAIAVFALIAELTSIAPYFIALMVLLVYLAALIGCSFLHDRGVSVAPDPSVHAFLAEQSSSIVKNTQHPAVVFNKFGTVLWCNAAAQPLLSADESCVGKDIATLLDVEALDVESFSEHRFSLCDRLYTAEGFALSEDGEGLYALLFEDVTELSVSEKRYADERVAVAYVAIDNVEDILQYVHEKFQDAVSAVDDILKRWAKKMNGVIKSYDTDKYVMFFDCAHLEECIRERFSILDDIRETRIGDGISVTVSIGVSGIGGTLAERESCAKDAIDLALQRGGDQAVYKTEDTTEYYGGRTKSVYKRANVRSRTFTNQLMALMGRADNVLIMGHRYGDFDSFGASVGLSRLGLLCGVKTNIAVDMRDKNLNPLIRMMQRTPEFSQIFVDNAEGLDLLNPDTLVVLCDFNTAARAQFHDIVQKAAKTVIVDHHRQSDKVPENAVLSYIEPSASSTCELVSEMLQNAVLSQNITKVEADMLLSGILLDTKQFTRNTGTRTFAAAQYLRGAGASPSDVYDLFKTDASDLSKEARFHTAITIYHDNIAISSCDGETDETYRVIASKAADKMLTLRDIDAAFTLVRIGEQIHISGRSTGKINVQLILEKLHGGGHFDVAGAQVEASSVLSVLEMLKSAIDQYFEEQTA